MARELRVAQIGCGKMSIYTMRYVFEKKGKIVCAFDIAEDRIGKDIGKIMGTKDTGVVISHMNDIDAVLKKTKPDVAIITTMSLMSDLESAFEACARNGVNAISTCEEAFFPWNSNPKITKKLDKLAKEHNCTLSGSGYQDFSWGSLIGNLCGTTHNIKRIVGRSSYNVEDYGIALAEVHGAGLPLDRFEKEIASVDNVSDEVRKKMIDKGEYAPSYMWNVNGWLCSYLGLTVTRQTQKCVPQTYKKDLHSSTLGMTVKKGNATGMSAVVTTETKEGITIVSECIGKVYAPEEYDENIWTVEGEPTTTVTVAKPATVEMTCASIVNRLIDTVKAPAGFITTEKMGDIRFIKELKI